MTASIYVVERGFRDGVSENYHSEIIGVYADKSIANKVMTSEDDSLTTYVLEGGEYVVHMREDLDGYYYRRTII